MSRTLLATLLGVSLVASSLQAEEPFTPLLRAALAEASRQTSPAPAQKRMPPKLKWTGIGLLAGGSLLLLSGVLREDSACPDDPTGYEVSCVEHYLKRTSIEAGAAAAGTGGLLLFIGSAKRQSVPSVDFQGTRVAWRIRF